MSLKIFQNESSQSSTELPPQVEELSWTSQVLVLNDYEEASCLGSLLVHQQVEAFESHQHLVECRCNSMPITGHQYSLPPMKLISQELAVPDYRRDSSWFNRRLKKVSTRKGKGNYCLLTIPDLGPPVFETILDASLLAMRIQRHAVDQFRLGALGDASFFAFKGKPVEIQMDEHTLAVSVIVDGQRHGRDSQEMQPLVDGRVQQSAVPSGQTEKSWEDPGFDFI